MAESSTDPPKPGPAPSVGPPALLEHLLSLLDSSPNLIFLKDTEYRYLYVNRHFQEGSGKRTEELIGHTDAVFMPPETVAQIRADEARVLETRTAYAYEEEVRTTERLGYYSTVKLPVYDARGELVGLGAFILDITERKLQEAEKLAQQEEVIAAQQDKLRELSTPLLPIADHVLAMPLIGAVDPERAREILETLLQGIATHRAHTAIIDVTGIRQIDTEVARALVNAARAARLVGAQVVLTGISPEVAQTLVTLGVDLAGITTLATLASGIAFALRS